MVHVIQRHIIRYKLIGRWGPTSPWVGPQPPFSQNLRRKLENQWFNTVVSTWTRLGGWYIRGNRKQLPTNCIIIAVPPFLFIPLRIVRPAPPPTFLSPRTERRRRELEPFGWIVVVLEEPRQRRLTRLAPETASDSEGIRMRGNFLSRRAVQRLRQLLICTAGSIKIKLILCCCVAFTVILLLSRASVFTGWTNRSLALKRSSVPRFVQLR